MVRPEFVLDHLYTVRSYELELLNTDHNQELLFNKTIPGSNLESAVVNLPENDYPENQAFSGEDPSLTTYLVDASWEDLTDSVTFPEYRSTNAEAINWLSKLLLPAAGVRYVPEKAAYDLPAYCPNETDHYAQAEQSFFQAYRQILKGVFLNQSEMRVYHDDQANPTMLQKNRLALTLMPLKVEGAYIPPGSIVRPAPESDMQITGIHVDRRAVTKSFLMDNTLPIRPTRLSAWAFTDQTDQAMFAARINRDLQPTVDVGRLRMLQQVNLTDFSIAAWAALVDCQI